MPIVGQSSAELPYRLLACALSPHSAQAIARNVRLANQNLLASLSDLAEIGLELGAVFFGGRIGPWRSSDRS
jgi:hypothetical protein